MKTHKPIKIQKTSSINTGQIVSKCTNNGQGLSFNWEYFLVQKWGLRLYKFHKFLLSSGCLCVMNPSHENIKAVLNNKIAKLGLLYFFRIWYLCGFKTFERSGSAHGLFHKRTVLNRKQCVMDCEF